MDNFTPELESLRLTDAGQEMACELLEARVETMPDARWAEISYHGKLEPVRNPTNLEVMAILLAWSYAQSETISKSEADIIYDNVLIALTARETD